MPKLKIDLDDLLLAFDNSSPELESYLDTTSGYVLFRTEDLESELNRFYEENEGAEDDDEAFEAALVADMRSDDEKGDLRHAHYAAADVSGRYVNVPHHESRDGYADMEEFIETVSDAHLRDLLEVAIQGRGAFRRFKDTVARDAAEEKRWFAYSASSERRRALEWLAEEGIEPLLENEEDKRVWRRYAAMNPAFPELFEQDGE